MPPSGFSQKAVGGALIFIKTCYEDLQAEVIAGKHKSLEAAIDHEIKSIGTALSKLHINDKGDLEERP